MGVYLLAIRSILKKKTSKLLIPLQWSHHEAPVAGFFSERSRQVNDFSRHLMSDHSSPSTISSELEICTGAKRSSSKPFSSPVESPLC